MKRLFKGGIIVSGEGQKKLDILVKGEKILAVGENLEFRDAEIEDVRASTFSRDLLMHIPIWLWKSATP